MLSRNGSIHSQQLSHTPGKATCNTRVPGCGICEKPFTTENQKEARQSQSDQIVGTFCGHLYHMRCLEGAFVHEKVRLADKNLPNRRTCPYNACRKDLSRTQLYRVNLVGVAGQSNLNNTLSPATNDNATIKELRRLQTENYRLRAEVSALRDKESTRVGEKVFLQNSNGTYSRATVTELLVKVVKDPDTDLGHDQQPVSMNAANNGGIREKFSNFMREAVVPINQTILAKHFRKLQTSSEMKARWCAGERVFIPTEQKHATIKWIGSRDQAFMALLEYDERISNEILSDNGLPMKPKPYHCKMVYLNELNNLAQKARDLQVQTPISRFFRFNPLRQSARQ